MVNNQILPTFFVSGWFKRWAASPKVGRQIYIMSAISEKTFECSLFCVGLSKHIGILDTIRDLWSFLISNCIKLRFERLTRYAVTSSLQLWTYICSKFCFGSSLGNALNSITHSNGYAIVR